MPPKMMGPSKRKGSSITGDVTPSPRLRTQSPRMTVARLASENVKMREELASLKTTVNVVVAMSVGMKACIRTHRYRKARRTSGHEGASRSSPEHADSTLKLDQSVCHRCGGVLSEGPTEWYTRVVEDIVPAKRVVTKNVVRRRDRCECGDQVSPVIPNGIGSSERRPLEHTQNQIGCASYSKVQFHLTTIPSPDA